MIITRTANQCGKADYGWLKARYTFSFGHYFDPNFLNYGALRVLNQEILAPKAEFKPKAYPHVDILNLILQGEAEYRDSAGNYIQARQGECLLFSTRQDLRYSEHNISDKVPLNRLQLWLNANPHQAPQSVQRRVLSKHPLTLLASPTAEKNSMCLRQSVWISSLMLRTNDTRTMSLQGRHAYLQSISGNVEIHAQSQTNNQSNVNIKCGDGIFIQDEPRLRLRAISSFQGLLIDLGS
ncbi:pirin family protein [Xenorhabdus budapestensis]|uniref:Pirin family protein n=1 Tax=Xenorhabdus budapestensis TaxID=290110 RepID=A0A2D0IZU6_XENBU|nr:pirin family protein [Xenorhabdus budapestensis]PHM27461.1 quercetin 2,3-dioxygenase [Xenorhabdus budapestensis]QTL40251.1 pirin family protein [Xenorhabdus budapestensis]